MREPRRKRDISIAAFVGAAAIVAWGFIAPPAQGTWLGVMMMIALTGAFFAACGVVMYTVGAYRQARLLGGENVIAQWRVDAKRWDAFAAYDQTLARTPGALANMIAIRAPAPVDGVTVIVGKGTMQIGEEFCMLDAAMIGPIEWLDGPPPALSFALEYANSDGPNTRKVLRVPTAANRESDAKRVLEHYRAITARAVRPHPLVGAAHRHPEAARNISIAVMVACVPLFLIGMALTKNQDLGVLPLIAMVSAPIVFIGAAVIALLAHFRALE